MKEQLVRVHLKGGYVFDGKKIYVQSMLSKPSFDVAANVEQAKSLKK